MSKSRGSVPKKPKSALLSGLGPPPENGFGILLGGGSVRQLCEIGIKFQAVRFPIFCTHSITHKLDCEQTRSSANNADRMPRLLGQTKHLGTVSCLRLSNIVRMRMSVLAGRGPPKLPVSAKSSYRWPKLGLPLRCELASATPRHKLFSPLCPPRR
jgi:hypothetical protein